MKKVYISYLVFDLKEEGLIDYESYDEIYITDTKIGIN